ncbi:hypothetical protein HMPREF1580_00846 [Gardnerella vaginalis JCP8070]|nr:hypothetical protein HMPREF1580_00846 [Gardnerella vaginalis JCP8070]
MLRCSILSSCLQLNTCLLCLLCFCIQFCVQFFVQSYKCLCSIFSINIAPKRSHIIYVLRH